MDGTENFRRWACVGHLKKHYRASEGMSPIVLVLINRSTNYENIARMRRVHTPCSEIVTDVTGEIAQWVWGREDLWSLERKAKEF